MGSEETEWSPKGIDGDVLAKQTGKLAEIHRGETQSFRYVCSGSFQSDLLGLAKEGGRVDLFEHARRVS
jgi:hypothetical protein